MPRLIALEMVVTLALAGASGWLLSVGSADAFWASNVSLTWLLLPLWFGWRAGGVARGAALGTVNTQLALGAYYFAAAGHAAGWKRGRMIEYTVQFGGSYFALGLLSGPVIGAIGGWWRRTPTLLVPLAVLVLAVGERWAWAWKLGFDPASGAFTAEAVVGAALAASMALWTHRARRAPALTRR